MGSASRSQTLDFEMDIWLTVSNFPHILRTRIYVLCSVKYKNIFCSGGTGLEWITLYAM